MEYLFCGDGDGDGDGVLIRRNIQDNGDGDEVLLPDCCRVPSTIRRHKEEPYTPKVVSVGPFYHGNERLRDMEMHKKCCIKDSPKELCQPCPYSEHQALPFSLLSAVYQLFLPVQAKLSNP